jgi:DNA-binding GntR family transcriptional regulator
MTATLPRLRRERASDSVFDVLRNNILSRAFRSGDRLDVKALASQLGVSPTPVKDAITRLAAEGLIEVRPRAGTYVAEIQPEAVAETFEIRRALECLAAEKLVERVTPECLDRFAKIVEALERPVSNEASRVEHERRNVELHMAIVEGAGNKKLVELYKSLNAHLTIAKIHRRRSPNATRLDQERKEHRAMLDALRKKDTRKLVDTLAEHIRRAGAALVDDVASAQAGESA